MTIPELDIPTDNFYKFGAVLCIALCISCIFSVAYLGQKHNDNVSAYLHKYVEYSFKEIGIQNKDCVDSKISQITKDINDLMKLRKKNTDFIMWFLVITTIISLIGSFLFFYFWYQKTQKPLDELLTIKVKKEKD
jgi:hypothetical protein